MDDLNHYQLLGVSASAETGEIRQAVRTQRALWTRRQGLPGLEVRYEAELRVRAITEAERVLTDPAHRREYDAALASAADRAAPPAPAHEPSVPGPRVPEPQRPPVDGTNWVAEARSHFATGDWEAVHAAALRATEVAPANREAWHLRAHASLQLAEMGTAEAEASVLASLGPTEAAQWDVIAQTHVAAQRWAKAAAAYREAARLDPTEPDHRAAEADMLSAQGDPARAIAILEELVAGHPRRPELREQLADALLDETIQRWTLAGDDRFATTLEQFAHTEGVLRRVGRLGVRSPEVVEHVSRVAAWLRKGSTEGRT